MRPLNSERHPTRRPQARRRGTALVFALVVVGVVSSLGAGYLLLSRSIVRRNTASLETTQAFYIAEAGLAEAFQAVRMGRTGQTARSSRPRSTATAWSGSTPPKPPTSRSS